jgi:hypothetical protein
MQRKRIELATRPARVQTHGNPCGTTWFYWYPQGAEGRAFRLYRFCLFCSAKRSKAFAPSSPSFRQILVR